MGPQEERQTNLYAIQHNEINISPFLPDPEKVEKLEAIAPGTTKQIMRMMAGAIRHQQNMEREIVASNVAARKSAQSAQNVGYLLGLIGVIFLNIAFLGLIAYLFYLGHTGIASIAGLVQLLVLGCKTITGHYNSFFGSAPADKDEDQDQE